MSKPPKKTGQQIDSWLESQIALLETAGIATARLDVLVLLEDALQKDRAWILAQPDIVLESVPLELLEEQINRRAQHEPLAYIRGKSEFYGREFMVTPATLQPRPETETMIDLLKTLHPANNTVLADIGTGSGAIAITAKLEFPHFVVHGTEIQPDALATAQKNREKHTVDVKLYKGNLLEPLMNTKIDILLANLPYVPDDHTINPAAMQEPQIAIFGGKDGLTLYRELFKQISKHIIKPPTYALTESLPFQHEELANIARKNAYELQRTEDFIQIFRHTDFKN